MPFDQSEVRAGGEQLPESLPSDPFPLVLAWFNQAAAAKVQPNPNVMTLATASRDGRPSARMVLCKGIDAAHGFVVFYTNYQGRKAQELEANPRAALVAHWDDLDRQMRIEGPVVKSPAAESDAYFASRPRESRIGAWASDQSRPIASRHEMVKKVEQATERFGAGDVPRPAHWGGYRVFAERVELWVSGAGRVHDRAAWTRQLRPDGAGFVGGPWASTRLQP
jgi:pyridoxamine 5'-phosphate oxidase